MTVFGTTDARFARVREAFAANFEERGELGACTALYLDGRLVVDLWGGHMDAAKRRPWQRDTLVNVWSLGKAMSALTMLLALDRGEAKLDDRVATHWPDFAAADKSSVTLEHVLAHRAGLPGVTAPLPENAHLNWQLMTAALAAQQSWWPPGTAHGYHTNTIGFLIGEVLRRATGERLRDLFRQRLAEPLGIDFHFGIERGDASRVADITWAPVPAGRVAAAPTDVDADDHLGKMRQAAYLNPPMSRAIMNTLAWRMAEFPSTNPQSNARAIATMFGRLAAHMTEQTPSSDAPFAARLPTAATLRDAITPRSDGTDLVLDRPTKFGLGFQLSQPDRPLGQSAAGFGHYGAGGHIGFADPDVPFGFSYNMNSQGFAWRDPRNLALIDAVYDCLAR